MPDWWAHGNAPEEAEELVEILDYVNLSYGAAALWHLAVTVLVTRLMTEDVDEHVYVLGDYVVTCRREG